MQLLPLLAWTLLPGCWAVRGPGTVEGYLGESVSVTCKYQPGQERNPKFWCKPILFICATDILITSKQQPIVWWDRFSIRDNRARQEFTVTIEGLAEGDAGTYRCGVRTGIGRFDERDDVEVIVSPAPTFSSASPYTPTTEHPRLTSSVSDLEQTTPQGESVQPGSNPHHYKETGPSQPHMIEHILTSGIVVVLLLLAIAVGVLVMVSRKKKKALSGAAVEMERTRSMSHTGADVLTYVDIDHRTGTAESQLYSNAEAFRCLAKPETEYTEVKKQSNKHLEEEKAVYASVQNSWPEQQEIYTNVPSAPRPKEEPGSAVQEV